MAVYRWIVRVRGSGIGAIWVLTLLNLIAVDGFDIALSLSKGLFGLLSTVLIACFLTRRFLARAGARRRPIARLPCGTSTER